MYELYIYKIHMENNNQVNLKELRPTEDFAFKRIFGSEDSKRSLMSLLNAILDGNPYIKDLKILNTETRIESRDNKASRLDIEVKTNDNTFINVELQCVDTGDLYSRSVFYASSLMIQSSVSGESYDFPKVISIWIIRDKIKKGIVTNRISPIEEVINCVTPTRWGDGYDIFTNKSRIIWIQLYKFKKDDNLKQKINKLLQDWIQFFDKPEKVDNKNDEGIIDAKNRWTKISSNDALKAQIRAQEKYEMDRKSEIAIAKREGLAEGEYKKAVETAKNLLVMNLSIEQIAQATGLSIDDLKKIQQ